LVAAEVPAEQAELPPPLLLSLLVVVAGAGASLLAADL
jgi:hypothetical protein